MRSAVKILCLLPMALATLLLGCTDPNVIIDQNTAVADHNWAYGNPARFDVKIDDAGIPYNLYFNLRVGAGYRYSNIFILYHQSGPGGKSSATRMEFTLAGPDGEWLGTGSGNLYSYQMLFRSYYRFPAKGTYHMAIEQNMRDNPLHEVSDVGLRVEKAQ